MRYHDSLILLNLGLQGKISREEVARICIAALESPYACDKTFEVVAYLSNTHQSGSMFWCIRFERDKRDLHVFRS